MQLLYSVQHDPEDTAQRPLRSNLQLWFHFLLAIQSHDNTQGGDSAALAFPLCQGPCVSQFSLYILNQLFQKSYIWQDDDISH